MNTKSENIPFRLSSLIDNLKCFYNDTNKYLFVVYALLLVWLALRATLVFLQLGFNWDDEAAYLSFSQAIANGKVNMPMYDGFLRESEYLFLMGFVNAVYGAIFLKIFSFDTWFWSSKLPSLIQAFSLLFFIVWWAKNKKFETVFILLIVALLGFDPLFWTVSDWLRPDISLSLYFTLSIYFLYTCLFYHKPKSALWGGIFGGMAIMSKMETLAIVPIAILSFLLCSNNLKSAIKNILFFACGLFIICLPYYGWILIDPTRLEILKLQIIWAHKGSIKGLSEPAHKMMDIFANAGISSPILPFLIKCYKIAQATAAPFLTEPKSIVSWIIGSVTLFSFYNIKRLDYRFWFIVFTFSIFTLSFAHNIIGERMIMLLPLSVFVFISILREDPLKLICFSALSALIFLTWFLLLLIINPVSASFAHFGICFSAMVVSSAGALYLYLLFRNKSIANLNHKIVVALALICVVYIYKASASLSKTDSFYSRQEITAFQKELHSFFKNTKHTIASNPSIYPFFPENIRFYSSGMFRANIIYDYWDTYENFTKSLNVDMIFISDDEQNKWEKNQYANDYLKNNFTLEKVFTTIRGKSFYFYKQKNI